MPTTASCTSTASRSLPHRRPSRIPWYRPGTKTVVGAHGNGQTTYDWTGKIDDVRIYNRALCPTEIQQIKNLGGTFGGVKVTKWIEIQ